ncbi:uncharacterized protein N7529_008589 [Penicillium soppii]|jgi:HAD superfamily hydrolase (TIGR01509 family)|uniref:uncharacterized protein n=1 Tax=Penicillium soppii TaxID=69789 RepID=UPI002549460D|nr:uncharacterized protein N7529_008589 [Penicillium soppii]KAJ5861279.1 hypothetical protein N7529_008589 [Penicillium soppii]
MSPYTAIAFDMGDVLFNWNPQAATEISVQSLGQITKCDLWDEFERGNVTPHDCYHQLGRDFNLDPSKIAATFLQTTGSLTPNETMSAIVRELKSQGLLIYMMTNIPRPDFDTLRATDYMWDVFDGVFASGYLGMRKPDACFYKHVFQSTGVPPAEMIFVDDKLENVVTARELGMAGIHFKDTTQACQEIKDLVDRDIRDKKA